MPRAGRCRAIAAAILVLAASALALTPPATIDAHLLNGSGSAVSLSVDGKAAVECKDGAMCDFKIVTGKHSFRARMSGGEAAAEYTVPAKAKMVCISITTKRVFDFSDCGQ